MKSNQQQHWREGVFVCLIIKNCLTVSKEGGRYLGSWCVAQSPHPMPQQLHFPGELWKRRVGVVPRYMHKRAAWGRAFCTLAHFLGLPHNWQCGLG